MKRNQYMPFIPNEVFHRPDGVSEIRLSRGMTTLIDTADYILVAAYRWHAQPSTSGIWYASAHSRIGDNLPRIVFMHRMLLSTSFGHEVDHRDGDGLNNRRGNLRSATKAQNTFNRKVVSHSSRYTGVNWNKANQKWFARITAHGKFRYLGYFNSEEAAYEARLAAEKEAHPDFQRTVR